MSEPAVAAPAETPEEELERLRAEGVILRTRVSELFRIVDKAPVSTAQILSLEATVARQRLQLRQQNDSFWRKRQANRRLQHKVDRLSARLKEVDPEWYESFRREGARD